MFKNQIKNSIEQNMILRTDRTFFVFNSPTRVTNGYKINSKYKTKIRVNKLYDCQKEKPVLMAWKHWEQFIESMWTLEAKIANNEPVQ